MKKTKLILIIVGAVIMVGLVFGYGYGLGRREVAKVEVPVLELLASPMVRSVQAAISGQVTEITNRTLTVANGNEILQIPISPDVHITAFVFPSEQALKPEQVLLKLPERKDIMFEDIKINDEVDILANVLIDGRIEGIHIMVRR